MKITTTLFALLFIFNFFISNPTFAQDTPSTNYHVVGTEPFWSLMISETKAEFDLMDSPKIKFDSVKKMNLEGTSGEYAFAFQVSNKDVSGVIILRQCDGCSDGMSEVKYSYEGFFTLNGKIYHGAGNLMEK